MKTYEFRLVIAHEKPLTTCPSCCLDLYMIPWWFFKPGLSLCVAMIDEPSCEFPRLVSVRDIGDLALSII